MKNYFNMDVLYEKIGSDAVCDQFSLLGQNEMIVFIQNISGMYVRFYGENEFFGNVIPKIFF